jgi:hypothetical protein
MRTSFSFFRSISKEQFVYIKSFADINWARLDAFWCSIDKSKHSDEKKYLIESTYYHWVCNSISHFLLIEASILLKWNTWYEVGTYVLSLSLQFHFTFFTDGSKHFVETKYLIRSIIVFVTSFQIFNWWKQAFWWKNTRYLVWHEFLYVIMICTYGDWLCTYATAFHNFRSKHFVGKMHDVQLWLLIM